MDTQRSESGQRDLAENVLDQLKRYWEEYGRIVLVAAVLIVAVVVGYSAYTGKLDRERQSTWQRLSLLERLSVTGDSSGSDPKELYSRIIAGCQEILDSQWTTKATPCVLLKLADTQQEAGLLADAVATHYRLLDEYPESVAARIGRPSLAAALEDMGRYREAAELYEELARAQGDSSSYWLAAARSRELAHDAARAQEHYRRLLGAGPAGASYAAEMAAFRLKEIQKGNLLTLPPAPEPEAPEEESEAGPEPAVEGPAAGPETDLKADRQTEEPKPVEESAPEEK